MPRYDIAHLRIVIVRLVFPHGVIDPIRPVKRATPGRRVSPTNKLGICWPMSKRPLPDQRLSANVRMPAAL